MTSSGMRTLKVMLAVTLMGACAGLLQHPSSPFRWRDGDRIKVPHQVHKENDVDCVGCHEAVPDAKDMSKRLLPKEDKCMECHEEWKAENKCSLCHTDLSLAGTRAGRSTGLNINHVAHLERTKDDCTVCHAKLSQADWVTGSVPTMESCFTCHNHKEDFDEGRCDHCHTSLARYAQKPKSFFSHEGDFLRTHKQVARTKGAQCSTCHEQNFCSDCHSANTVAVSPDLLNFDRVDRAFIHRNDFRARHSLEARGDPTSCLRCHGTSFCVACHTENNVTPEGMNPHNPHPPGYAFPGAMPFHGTDARRDIIRCAACHDQGASSVCVECHKVGGVGGNPHPMGWSNSHNRQEIQLNSMCMYCHNL